MIAQHPRRNAETAGREQRSGVVERRQRVAIDDLQARRTMSRGRTVTPSLARTAACDPASAAQL